ncbi:MAG: hypothetical protein RJS97_00515 [Parvibaculaceae bacterium]|jgi:hypothetical protein|tara:strand:- start:1105 stop:1398 length:294 start_codon:yes stop_codon:yes gene_type:complete
MAVITRIKTGLLYGGLSLIPLIFGGYLIYDRVILSLRRGQIEERVGMIDRASEPISFWISVGMYGSFGSLIAGVGLWGFWQLLKPERRTKGDIPGDT